MGTFAFVSPPPESLLVLARIYGKYTKGNMSTKSAALRAQLESALSTCIPAPFTFREHHASELVPSGVTELDALTVTTQAALLETPSAAAVGRVVGKGSGQTLAAEPQGGLPRGALTEIVGPSSSGRTSLMLSLLAQMTARQEVCALVDSSDAFDPHSAEAAGVDLKRLLWVRCGHICQSFQSGPKPDESSQGRPAVRHRQSPKDQTRDELEQALRATDLLLAGGGFGLVVIDLGDIPPQLARRVPLAHWFRFRRAVENTPTVLVVLEQSPFAKTCASLVLRLEPSNVYWSELRDVVFSDAGPSAEIAGEAAAATARTHHGKFQLLIESRDSRYSRIRACASRAPGSELRAAKFVSHACVLRGARLELEIIRSRLQHAAARSMRTSFEVSAA
jgi:hypothetical protein